MDSWLDEFSREWFEISFDESEKNVIFTFQNKTISSSYFRCGTELKAIMEQIFQKEGYLLIFYRKENCLRKVDVFSNKENLICSVSYRS